jgi:L-alanine-DL-glutamate epimerase-like enolase superfamily enzyme
MRLADYSLHVYRLPYERPVRWSDVVEEAAQFLLLKLVSDTCHTGVAEIVIKPTWTGASLRSLAASIEDVFVPLLQKQRDLSDPAFVRCQLDGIPENHAAKALIDNAVWDLNAARLGVSPGKMWGGSDVVPLSFTVTRQAPEKMAAEAVHMVERYGFRTLKIKGGQDIDTDVNVLHQLRSALGHEIRLYVDANGAYAPAVALNYIHAMADAGAEVVEDPCVLAPDAFFTRLQQSSRTAVLVDFYCWSPRDMQLFIAAGARAFSLKPGRLGLSDAHTMGELAKAAGCQTVVGMFGESMLGTLTALQLSSILPSHSLPAETTWFLAMTEQITHESLTIKDGAIQLPTVAGNAALIDWEHLERLS